MKILNVTLGFYPSIDWGGPGLVVLENSAELVRRGHEVTVCASDLLNKRERITGQDAEAEIRGIRALYLRTYAVPRWPGSVGPTYVTRAARRRLEAEVEAVDLVHVHGTRTMLTVLAARLALRHGRPLVLQPHGTLQYIVSSVRMKKVFDPMFVRPLVRRAHAVVALTPAEVGQIEAQGRASDDIELIPNGLAHGLGDDIASGSFRARLSIADDELVVLFVGRINRKKGVDLLVRGFAGLPRHLLEKARLVIVGPDDGQLSVARALAREGGVGNRVLFPGSMDRDQVVEALADADVFALTCRTDTFPMSLVEACHMGVPCLVTDTCEIAGLLNGRAAEVVLCDVPAVSAGLNRLLDDDARRKDLSDGARRLASSTLSVGAAIDRLEDLYESITR